MMKIALLATSALVSLATFAHAADVPQVALSPATAYSWEGFYAGVHAGVANHVASYEDSFYDWYGATMDFNSDGLLGGVQAGYNWQRGATVLGLEADFSLLSNDDFTRYAVDNDVENSASWLATLRGRAGLGLDRSLLYVTAGVAFADFDRSWIEDFDPDDSWPDLGDNKVGVVAGFGFEHAVTARLTARAEALFAAFDENTTINENDFPLAIDDSLAVLRAGLNYRFGAVEQVVTTTGEPGLPADFSGFYLGLNAGGGQTTTAFTDVDYFWHGATYDVDANGFAGGVQAGYNWQSGATLLGVEADFSMLGMSEDGVDTEFSTDPSDDVRHSSDAEWLASVRARAGLVASNSILYVTAGVAVADFDAEFNYRSDLVVGLSGTQFGPIVGGGFEHAITDRLSARVEGLYASFDGEDAEVDDWQMHSQQRVVLARAGLNYRLGGSRPAAGSGIEAPLFDWTGPFAGAEIAFAEQFGTIRDTGYWDYGNNYNLTSYGIGGGAHAGFNWQQGHAVFGVIADIGAYSNDEEHVSPDYRRMETGMSWLATVRGRAGLASGRSLLYGTAGLAIADFDTSWAYIPEPDDSDFENLGGTKLGWVVGAGFEHAITERITARLEGLFAKFEEEQDWNGETGGNRDDPFLADGWERIVTVKGGVSYHF